MTTFTQLHPLNSAAALLARPAQTARRAATVEARRPAAPTALWQQSVRIHESRSRVERLVCLLLIVLVLAVVAHSALVMARTFDGDNFQQAVSRIATHGAR